MKKCKKILSQIVFYGALLLIVAASVFFFLQKKSGQPMFFFGRCILWVETGSMQPTIPERSYILTRSAGEEVRVGDVIVFLCRDESAAVYGSYVTHRVTAQTPAGYQTQGDSPLSLPDPWTVQPGDILAVYERNLPVMTALGRLFSTPMGMVAVFALFFAMCGFVFIPSVVETVRKDEPVELTAEEMDDLVKKEVERLEKEGISPDAESGKTRE